MQMINLLRRYALLVLMMFPSSQLLAQTFDEASLRAIDYIKSHTGNCQKNCTYGDGYQCESMDEAQLILNQQRMIPAIYIEFLPQIYRDFRAIEDLSDDQKNLKHYKIGFAEDDDHYVVILSALLLPEINLQGEKTGLLRTTFGRSMRYLVNKKSLKITARHYYK